VSWHDSDVTQMVQRATIAGHPYAIASDENGVTRQMAQDCAQGTSPFGFLHVVDLAVPARPAVASTIALQTSDPANCLRMGVQGGLASELAYSSHYCSVDDPDDTTAVACTWMGSGLRVFDVRDPLHPRELAYYVPPGRPAVIRGSLLKAAILPNPNLDAAGSPVRWKKTAKGWELWFVSTQNGFQIVRLDPSVYPLARQPVRPPCRSRRTVRFTLPRGAHSVSVTVAGKRRLLRRRGRTLTLSLNGLPRGAVKVRIAARARGRRYVRTTTLHPCAPSKGPSS
jgi:hypothetical protein